jgi:hypothetical protein
MERQMTQQNQIELEMRIAAIEFLLCRSVAVMLKSVVRSDVQISIGLDQISEHAKTQKFPGLDAAMSDMASDEYAAAVKRLTNMAKVLVEGL